MIRRPAGGRLSCRCGRRGSFATALAVRPGRPRSAHDGGQATVEFSLVIVLLMVLMVGIVDLGRMVAMQAAAVTASREAARFGSAVGTAGGGVPQYVDCTGIRQAARLVTASLVTLPDAQIEVSYDDGNGNARSKACPPHGAGPSAAEITRFDRVIVSVTLTYDTISPLGSVIGPITVESTDRRAIVKP